MPSDQTQYELRHLPLFWDDLDNAVSCIANVLENPIAAERLLDSVEAKILDYSKPPPLRQSIRPHVRDRCPITGSKREAT